MSAVQRMMQDSLRASRIEHAQSEPEIVLEWIANYHASIAATAMDLREIIRMRQFNREARTPESEKAVAHLVAQIENHYEDTFGVPPSWKCLQKSP